MVKHLLLVSIVSAVADLIPPTTHLVASTECAPPSQLSFVAVPVLAPSNALFRNALIATADTLTPTAFRCTRTFARCLALLADMAKALPYPLW